LQTTAQQLFEIQRNKRTALVRWF